MFFPARCAVCGERGPSPCARCWRQLQPAPLGPCPAALDCCLALLRYDGPGRELVARLKYRDERAVVDWLVAAMAQLATSHPIDVVTWAPTTRARRLERGFDQAEVLARGVARRLGRPAARLLVRAAGPAQTGRSAAARAAARPRFSVRAASPSAVLLIDDVVTTGGTLSAGASALRQSGSTTVIGLVAARTPRKAA